MPLTVAIIVIFAFLFNLSNKGSHMEKRRIDKIDVKKDSKELIALYRRIELRNFILVLLYQHTTEKYVIKG
jgi:hypothetical protein